MPTINLQDVESSQIAALGYDAATNTLAIQFHRGWGENRRPGAIYHYQNVTPEQFAALRDAESIGKHFGQHIKPFPLEFPYTKVEDNAEQAQAA